jgi:hypothetical protein
MGKAWIYAAPGKQFFPDQNNLEPSSKQSIERQLNAKYLPGYKT